MTTKELIIKLQKKDPSGELHVRVCGGIPSFIEVKEGYWDGPYMYKEDDKMILSVEGHKVDLQVEDMQDFIWSNKGDLSKIEFRGFDKQESIDRYIKSFEKTSNEYKAFHTQSLVDFTYRLIEKLTKGYRIIEYKNKVNWAPPFSLTKDGKEEHMCFGERNAIIETGLFEISSEDVLFKYWRLKNGLQNRNE